MSVKQESVNTTVMPWATLSLKNLTNALHEVDDWWRLGIQLDIDYHELQKIVEVHSTVEQRKSAMLQLWRDKDVQVSWETLLVSLGKMNLKRIAENIKREYQVPSSIHSQGESPLVLSATAQSANVTTEDSPSTPPTAQPGQPLTSQSESVTMAPPLTPPTDQPEQTLTSQSESVTMAPPLPPTAQPEQSLTTQSESVTMAPPSTPPTDQPEQTRVRKMQQEIATLVNKYDDLVSRTVETFSEMQEDSHFCRRLQFSVAVLPTSLKYQHQYFLEQHSAQIAKSTTVAEILSILNNYCDFLNCSLLAHIIGKFGDDKLQKQLSNYMEALREFRSHTKIADFMETCTGSPNLSPDFVALETKMSPEWEHRTLEEAEEYHKTMTQNSSLANYVVSLVKVKRSSIYLVWSVPEHAVQYLAAAMDSDFLQHHGIEAVAIDGEDLEAYKRRYYLYMYLKVIQQV